MIFTTSLWYIQKWLCITRLVKIDRFIRKSFVFQIVVVMMMAVTYIQCQPILLNYLF